MNADLLADLRRHQPILDVGAAIQHCVECGAMSPCIVSRALAALTEATEASAYHANEWHSDQLVIAISEEREAYLEARIHALEAVEVAAATTIGPEWRMNSTGSEPTYYFQ